MSSKKAENPGALVVISAPSGCGKTTVIERLLKRHPDWTRSISVTTRKPRDNEKKDEDYIFVSATEFQKMKAAGGFLEFAEVFGASYGTPKDFVERQIQEGKIVILAIDVQGMKKIKNEVSGKWPLLTIFMLPPSVKVLRDRLEGRKTEDPDEIQKRLDIAQEEIKQADLYHKTVINQNLEQTLNDVDEMVSQFQKERGF